MRILSDFDGVWTDQADEAAAIQAWYAREGSRLIGIPEEEGRADFEAFRRATLADPAHHGWWPRGYLTAFVDEDELLATGAVSYWLDAQANAGEAAHPSAERWLAALRRAGYESAQAFGNAMFEPAMRHHRDRGGHRLVPEAKEVVEELRARGVDLVIVSNSPTDKLEAMFADIDVHPGSGVRFVGDARKWWIEDPAPHAVVAGRRVHLDRPLYRAVLEREVPDVIIGDVVSLDLALAASMRQEGELASDMELLLRDHPRASDWAKTQTLSGRDARLVDRVVPSIRALVE